LEAQQAVSFFIYLSGFSWDDFYDNDDDDSPLLITLDNSKTQEKFVIKDDRFGRVKILRYPARMDGDKESIESMSKIPNRRNRNVTLNFE
jgi:hypothetical protein